eukprot:5853040-Prymnesium_polylepis.1
MPRRRAWRSPGQRSSCRRADTPRSRRQELATRSATTTRPCCDVCDRPMRVREAQPELGERRAGV